MLLEPKHLVCCECCNLFVFSVGEQEFFQKRALVNEPKRCPNCRVLMRMRREGKSVAVATETSCAECGQLTTLPFQPKGHRPVYCISCFAQRNAKPEQYTPSQVNVDTAIAVHA